MTNEAQMVYTNRDAERLRDALQSLPASSLVPIASAEGLTPQGVLTWIEAYRGELYRIFEENRTIQREAADLRRQQHAVQQFLGIDRLVDRLNEIDYRMHEKGMNE